MTLRSMRLQQLSDWSTGMDKDRVSGAAKQAKGSVKDAVGKMTGDSKLQAEGKADKVEGKIQNAIGGAKDSIRDAIKKS
ncbi:CsbD family protein [soil metagenome]